MTREERERERERERDRQTDFEKSVTNEPEITFEEDNMLEY
jgi:hypothetical protein